MEREDRIDEQLETLAAASEATQGSGRVMIEANGFWTPTGFGAE